MGREAAQAKANNLVHLPRDVGVLAQEHGQLGAHAGLLPRLIPQDALGVELFFLETGVRVGGGEIQAKEVRQ